jgi:iron complex outermembrane receptor protein
VENNPAPPHFLLPAEFGNGLLGTTKGIELAPEWKPVSFWRLRASYSFLQMNLMKGRNSQDIGSAPIVEGSSPRHQVTVLSGLDISKVVSFDLTYRYVSALPSQKIASYSTADVRLDWHLNRQVELSVLGANLLQPYHFEFASDPGPNVGIKRSVYGQILWRR